MKHKRHTAELIISKLRAANAMLGAGQTIAEVAVPRELSVAILERIQRLGVPPPLIRYSFRHAISSIKMVIGYPKTE